MSQADRADNPGADDARFLPRSPGSSHRCILTALVPYLHLSADRVAVVISEACLYSMRKSPLALLLALGASEIN